MDKITIETVGIIGAGQMGSGIAQVCAAHGFEVVLHDVSQDGLDRGWTRIIGGLDRQITKGKISAQDKSQTLAKIQPSLELAKIGGCDIIIEAATEQETIKQKIFDELKPFITPQTIIASNTSSISITRLAGRMQHPERFMGIHFMNPVPAMQLVELIRGIATSQATFDSVLAMVERLEKEPVVSADFPAFLVNRMLIPMINEAVYLLYEGVGSVLDIDQAMKLGANHPMGPLELADFIGLDTCLSIMNVLLAGLADSKYRPCPLLVKYVEAGWFGRKSGIGFYDYRGEKPVPTR